MIKSWIQWLAIIHSNLESNGFKIQKDHLNESLTSKYQVKNFRLFMVLPVTHCVVQEVDTYAPKNRDTLLDYNLLMVLHHITNGMDKEHGEILYLRTSAQFFYLDTLQSIVLI